ncbi:uncharacterized protein LOC131165539 [Malania oleifera]|uniref:uncharacterized protein LOC131165539 n=1 Tax=Malania oleifera TaxID=397392 RepID=UPI0025ADECF5|nr:uncharacterized protein LOC131165539 [Malania oleifera]
MVSREQKRAAAAAAAAAALHEKLQLLRSITHSPALNETSIIMDASKYIEELKQKVERLNQDVASPQNSHHPTPPFPVVTVDQTLENGFLINVFSQTSCSGFLVSILEVFEELGLNVLDARISCADNFQFEAVMQENEGQSESTNAQEVKQALLQAINTIWMETLERD